VQAYEGASTLHGRHSVAWLTARLVEMAAGHSHFNGRSPAVS
jgi:hypothetical protein